MSRGTPKKTRTEHLMTINRDMLTRNYWMKWDLDKCVGCQIGPIVCPKEALTHVPAVLENGHITQRPSVDVDETKCINCGSCVEACPKHAIELTVNGKPENPVIDYGAFPEFDSKTIFRKEKFDFTLKEFLIENCPTNVISYDEKRDTMRVDFDNCIHCRQCEVRSSYAVSNAFQNASLAQTSAQRALSMSTIMANWFWQIITASNAEPACRFARLNQSMRKKLSPLNHMAWSTLAPGKHWSMKKPYRL